MLYQALLIISSLLCFIKHCSLSPLYYVLLSTAHYLLYYALLLFVIDLTPPTIFHIPTEIQLKNVILSWNRALKIFTYCILKKILNFKNNIL